MNVVTAFDEKYVKDTLSKVWQELAFLDTCTEGAFKRLKLKTNSAMEKVASLVDTDGVEFGWKSCVRGVVADTPDKLRGGRTENIYFEESGNNKFLTETYTRGEPLVKILGKRIGTRFVFGCVCAGTKIWTARGEYKSIEDLSLLEGIVGFSNGSVLKELITYINPSAAKPCIRLTFSDNTCLECSVDHPIYKRTRHRPRNKQDKSKRDVCFSWDFEKAENLKVGDIIGQCRKIDIFGKDILFDPYLVGLLIGDGTYTLNNTPKLSNCDNEVLLYVKSKYDCSLSTSHITSDGKNYEEIRIKGICKNLRNIGIYGQSKSLKRLPLDYQTLNKENTALLLAGLFDTDGYINDVSKRITLTSSARPLLEQVLILLYKFGIYSTINKVNPCIKVGRKDKNQWYVLTILDGDSFNNFAENIPLKILYKQKALLNKVKRKDNHFIPEGIREVFITKIEDIGIQLIYNLTANGSHTYLANNIITHNTSGEQGPKLVGLKTMFYNPKGYSILPFYNTSTQSGDPQITGYFIPSYSMWFGSEDGTVKGFDDRGVVDEEVAKADYLHQWSLIEDPHDLLIKKAEYCFTPEDAFVLEGENMFDKEKLADLLANIEIHKLVEKPKNYKLYWPQKDGLTDRTQKPILREELTGKIQIVEMPILDKQENAMHNLYISGIDSIDVDLSTSTGQNDVSEFCMIILRRQYGLQSPKIVAIYKDRPKKIEDAFDNALKLCKFYGCKTLVEATRISIKNYFERMGYLSYMMHRPQATANTSGKTNFKLYGVPATQAIIEHQLELIDTYIDNYCDTIQFPNMLDELLRYSYANKRKFDIVAAFGICLLADEELLSQRVKILESQPAKMKDVGYYRDLYGRIKYGVILKEETSTMRYGWTRANRY